MAGEITFTLDLQNQAFLQSTARTQTAVTGFRNSVQEVEQAFNRAARAGRTDMESVERQINRTQQAAGRLNREMSFGANVRGGRAAFGVATSVAGLVAPGVASDLIMFQFIGQQLKGLGEAAKVAGLGVGSVGVALAAFAALAVIAGKGIETAKAQLNERESERALNAQSRGVADRLVKFIEAGVKNGQINQSYADDAIAQLTEPGLHPETLRERTRAIQETLRGVVPQDQLDAANDFFKKQSRLLTSEGLEGSKKIQFDATAQWQDTLSEINSQVGLTESQRAELRRLNDARYQLAVRPEPEPEAKIEKPEKEARPRFGQYQSPLTDLERIGFVITSGVRGSGAGGQRTLEEHTRQMVNEQKRTNALLSEKTNADFSHQ